MPTAIDLFCGLGGLSQGFMQAGYHILFANDFEEEQLESYQLNHPDVVVSPKDIKELTSDEILEIAHLQRRQLDVLLGAPPCQGFSTYGQRQLDDPRNQLFREFARILRDLQPRAFVMENVSGLLSMADGDLVSEIMQVFADELGYATTLMVLDAVNYGVPQFRRRIFFVGSRDGVQPTFPLPKYRSPDDSLGRRKRANGSGPIGAQLSLFSDDDGPTLIRSQSELAKYLSEHAVDLFPPLTVRDAISDLPSEAFTPREVDRVLPYPEVQRTPYQLQMKSRSTELTNHAAKRHMLRRMIRTALIDQGDYGRVIVSRLAERGIPRSIIDHILTGTFGEDDLRTIRNVDKGIEGQLLELLRAGEVAQDDIKEDIRSGGFANKYRRLRWNEPSHTLVAHMARDCSDFIHPELNRPITVREAARLQSFPDTFRFGSSHFRQLRGIGNAVPPLLAEALARHLVDELQVPANQLVRVYG